MNSLQNIKTAYLTIDDSPSHGFIKKVNYLLEKKIPAVFFCIGNLMERQPEQVIYAIKKGFPIGNHSYSHTHFSNLTFMECMDEIEKTDRIIEELYREAKMERQYKWFRFPYGDKGDGRYGEVLNPRKKSDFFRKESIQIMLKRMGYCQPDFTDIQYSFFKNAGLLEDIDWHWTFDIMEWATFQNKPTFGLKNITRVFRRMDSDNPKDCRGRISEPHWLKATQSAEIVLLHDHDETNDIFEPIIDKLLDLPIHFKSLI